MQSHRKFDGLDVKLFLIPFFLLVIFPINSISAVLSDLVTIEQVGDSNNAFVRNLDTGSTDPSVYGTLVTQNGNSNLVQIEQLGEDIFTLAQQAGNNNEIRVNISGSTTPSSFTASDFPFDGNRNRRDIFQDGNFNIATLTQIGDLNEAVIDQIGEGNNVVLSQVSPGSGALGNLATIEQNGNENFASVTQGTDIAPCDNCTATLIQTGNENGEPELEDGPALTSIFQTGTDNTASITQAGNENLAKISQGTETGLFCDNCTATITQTGNENGVVDPVTGDVRTTIFQAGFDNTATITQVGNGNIAEISQGANFGCSNCFAEITQTGDNNGVANPDIGGIGTRIVQDGSDLTATLSQTGSGNLALVEQGQQTAGALLTADIIQNGNDNNAIIRQDGYNNNASISQTGNENFGSITQIGDGLNAGITQAGNNNLAIIVQDGASAPAVFITQP